MFDKGILYGKKNPITGERHISRYSLEVFMKKHNISHAKLIIEKRRIILITSDEVLLSLIHKTFANYKRIKIEKVTFGCDALILCSKEPPDLLIIDEELPDISGAEVVKSLKRMEELKNIKILYFFKSDKISDILEWGVDEYISKDTIDKVVLAKKVNSLLKISETRPTTYPVPEHERRSWPRIEVDIPAKIKAYYGNNPPLQELGEATIKNISLGGAYLSRIQLINKIIPSNTFRFLLEVNHPPMENWEAESKVLRLQFNGDMTAGIQFVNISRQNEKKILDMINQQHKP